MTGYSTREVAEVLGLPVSRIRSLVRSGLLSPATGRLGEHRFSFRDIVLCRAIRELEDAEVSPRRVRRALRALRDRLPEGRSLSSVRIATDGTRVLVHEGDRVWDAESGQIRIDFAIADLAARAAPYARRGAMERGRSRGLDADAWFDIGVDLEAVDVREAERAYRQALDTDSKHWRANVNLGRLLHERGDPSGAARLYRRALAIDPANVVAAYDLGVALEDMEDETGAIGMYRRAVRLDPEHADAHFNLARLYERRGESGKALGHISRYRSLVPTGDRRG